MTIDHMILLAISVIFVGAIVFLKLRQQAINRRHIEQVKRENEETQEFVLSRLDAIGKLLEDTSISASELRQRSDSIHADMESRNVRGDLTPLIEDSRKYMDSEINRRKSV